MKKQYSDKVKEEKNDSLEAKVSTSTAWIYRRDSNSYTGNKDVLLNSKDFLISKKDFYHDDMNEFTNKINPNNFPIKQKNMIDDEFNSFVDNLSDLSLQTNNNHHSKLITNFNHVKNDINNNSNINNNHQESRIVAPNVSKLSPQSVVEIRLESNLEKVVVLCAVDVLKMRSGFFHDVLMEQERRLNIDQSSTTTTATNNTGQSVIPSNPAITLSPKPIITANKNNIVTSNNNISNKEIIPIGNSNNKQNNINNTVLLWREPIIVPESSPYEAAAYLESLHEGRALFQGEWNFCWARLSVAWMIEDLIIEYASQIVKHMNRLTSIIKSNHWRLNPNVLSGMRVAVFRKGSNPLPTIVTGIAIDIATNSNIGYSKLRIAFDQDKLLFPHPTMLQNYNNHYSNLSPVSSCLSHNSSQHAGDISINSSTLESRINRISYNNHNTTNNNNNIYYNNNTPINIKTNNSHLKSPLPIYNNQGNMQYNQGNMQHLDSLHHPHMNTNTNSNTNNNINNNTINTNNTVNTPNTGNIVGDVTEPLWVQIIKENAIWNDPDELFLIDIKKSITHIDKCMFWEMAKSLIEFTEYSIACHESSIRNVNDLAYILKRPEYRILWINEGAECLPKQVVSELIRAAYVPTNI